LDLLKELGNINKWKTWKGKMIKNVKKKESLPLQPMKAAVLAESYTF
jgi:hypothetical protein